MQHFPQCVLEQHLAEDNLLQTCLLIIIGRYSSPLKRNPAQFRDFLAER